MKAKEFSVPEFQTDTQNKIDELISKLAPMEHHKILDALVTEVKTVDFRDLVGLTEEETKLKQKHFIVCCIEQILNHAKDKGWGFCNRNGFVYIFNGAFWSVLDIQDLQSFLGNAAEKMGIDKFDSKLYTFKEHLYKQFLSEAYKPKPKLSKNKVLINLRNGTFEINGKNQKLRAPNERDFLTYQLPFDYNPHATAPQFDAFLCKVLPDIERQKVLSEYMGYLFVKNNHLKLEKALLLYGNGANGKSVYFDIVYALLGGMENVSSHSLQNLTDKDGYYRAMISHKILNYASEINGKLDTSIFKALVSGEPVSARKPYGEPLILTDYAKLMFNCNELPRDIEMTHAFFRRFIIIAFDVNIPEAEQDKELANKIISSELSGIFNWVLAGLNRLLNQQKFTYCASVENEVLKYKIQSDSVQSFITDEEYERSITQFMSFKDLYAEYRQYCMDCGYRSCSKKVFSDRLRKQGFEIVKKNTGMVIFIQKVLNIDAPTALDAPVGEQSACCELVF